MIKDFSDLSLEAQIIIKERFARYGIDGVEVFKNPLDLKQTLP